MPILLGVLVSVAVIFAVFAVTLGRGGSMTQFQPDWPGRPLPEERTVRAADVGDAKFSVAFRGYRMAEVDDALDRLAAEIAERDDAILRLSGRPFESQRTAYAPTPDAPTPDAPTPAPAAPGAPGYAPLSDDTAPMGLVPVAADPPFDAAPIAAPVSDAPVDDTAQIYMRPPAPAPDDTAEIAWPPAEPPAAPAADPLGSWSWPTKPRSADDRPMYDGPDQ